MSWSVFVTNDLNSCQGICLELLAGVSYYWHVLDEAELRAEFIRLRNASELSQRALAKKIGVSYGTVNSFEAGRVSIWLFDALRWLEACGVDPIVWFIGQLSAEGKKERAADEQMLITIRRALRRKDRRETLSLFCGQWQAADERDLKYGKD